MNEFPNNNEPNYTWRVQGNEHYTLYTRNGLKHSIVGPAVTIGTDKYYYINGEPLDYNQWYNYTTGVHAYESSYYTREVEAWSKFKDGEHGIYTDGPSTVC